MQPRKGARSKKTFVVSLPELLLLASLVVLALQLLPGSSTRFLSALDPRQWTWRSYAIACGVWIIALVALRAWREATDE